MAASKRVPATMAMQTRPEPMNASPFHSKVKVSLALSDPIYVAGTPISGKMEMECKADTGLGIGIMMVELFAIQELTSRDHSATSTFLHSQRLFQGPGLPPSNAVLPHPIPGDPPLPQHYHQARRGQTTFFFRIPTPTTSPSAIDFGNGLACVRYEVRCTVGVAWKGERRLVTDKTTVDVVESYEEDDFTRIDPEGVIVGENGKIWIQGKVIGGLVVAGETACVELQVKNHSTKKTTGLQIELVRSLQLPNAPTSDKSPLQISDTLTTVAFRGPEYIVHPGTEGVASLVFDVPRSARSVKGGPRDGDEEEGKVTECLFEVRCTLSVKIGLPLGSKDIFLDLPVTILHPSAIPQIPASPPDPYAHPAYMASPPPMTPHPYLDRAPSPYAYPALPMSPPIHQQAYPNHTGMPAQVWSPPPQLNSQVPSPYQYFSPPIAGQQYYFPPPPPQQQVLYASPPRPLSTEPNASQALYQLPSGTPEAIDMLPQHQQNLMLPMEVSPQRPVAPEEGKGERASRIANHLRMSSRHRSVSPQSHRFPLPISSAAPVPITTMRNVPPSTSPLAPAEISMPGLSTSPGTDGVVHSPRPLLSPKHSYTIDPTTHNSLPKSERVEELERMADEVVYRKKDLSDDLPNNVKLGIEKTLPKPPPDTSKANLLLPPGGSSRPKVEAVFATTGSRSPTIKHVEHTPPTPTLTPLTPVRLPRTGLTRTESGLDALERKLLAQVGTRKVDKDEPRIDVRNVLPMAIPSPAMEPLNDSAISSLTLADHDQGSDGKTHQPGINSQSEDDRDMVTRRRRLSATTRGEGTSHGKEKGGERRNGRKKERGRDDEAHRLRKSAKGRVAAWLGGVDPEVPPEISPSHLPSVTGGPVVEAAGPAEDVKAVAQDLREEAKGPAPVIRTVKTPGGEEQPSSPDPRSSGFVPIGTLKKQDGRRQSGIRSQAKDGGPPFTSPIAREPPSPKVDRIVSPPSDALNANTRPHWANHKPPPKQPEFKPSKVAPSPRLPAFNAQALDPEVKYDIRSARGGRGGRVTAVASIWATQTDAAGNFKPTPTPQKLRDIAETKTKVKQSKTPPKTSSSSASPAPPETSLADLTARRAKFIKSASVPAVVSSSHASPTLSSTASLARSPKITDRKKAPIKVPATVSESFPETAPTTSKATMVKSTQSTGDLAFGQARLRDLIKKYQGPGTS